MAIGSILLPIPGLFDASAPPGIDFEDNRPRVLFDDTTVETMYWTFMMPQDFASGLIAKLQYSMASAVALEIEFEISLHAASVGEELDTPSFDTVNASGGITVPGTAGFLDTVSVTMTNDDSVAARDHCILKLERDSDDATNDDATGDLELVAISLEYTTS